MISDLDLSIVIPTHNRAAILRRCFASLFRQDPLPARSEIVIVDDGSADDTSQVVDEARATAPVAIEYVRQPASGPAAARNRGIRHARGAVVLFLGDDILPEPGLVGEHLTWHGRFPDPMVAVLGFVTWSPGIAVTPYMHWLESSGNQFDYDALRGREDVDPAKYLYTSNLSLKRSVFPDTGEWFDERFRLALLEDIDLGRRLSARGLRLKYNPDARAFHEHAVTLQGYARRIEHSSEYWVLLERKEAQAAAAVSPASDTVTPVRRDYAAYAWYLARVCGEIVRNWPSWRLARYFERRRLAPETFVRAHRHWAHRGLLRLEARRALARLGRPS